MVVQKSARIGAESKRVFITEVFHNEASIVVPERCVYEARIARFAERPAVLMICSLRCVSRREFSL